MFTSVLYVIHQSPDASNHRTPSKYRTEIHVIPTSIHLRLLPAESAFTAARNAHLLHQGFDCRARQAGHFTHVELAVFFPGSTKCKSIATVRTCVWQQIQMSKRLVPASPFTCYTFHVFATRLSGCINIFLKDFLLVQLSLRLATWIINKTLLSEKIRRPSLEANFRLVVVRTECA